MANWNPLQGVGSGLLSQNTQDLASRIGAIGTAPEQNAGGAVLGLAANAGFAIALNQKSNRLPKNRVLSSMVTLELRGANGNLVEIGEFDQFSFKKSFNVVKRWKPYGEKFERVLLEDGGWDLAFTCGKIDWRAAYIIYAQELALCGSNMTSNAITAGSTVGSLYVPPTFEIFYSVKHYNGIIEAYRFIETNILEFATELSGDNTEIPETFSAFARRRILDNSSTIQNDIAVGDIPFNSAASKIISDILSAINIPTAEIRGIQLTDAVNTQKNLA